MDKSVIYTAYEYVILICSSFLFKFIVVLLVAYYVWRLLVSCYRLACSSSAIHYVNFKRHPMKMVANYNPFSINVDYKTASYSGIKCKLKSQHACYVQALWGVPITSLLELLHGDWQSLVHAIITNIPAEKFSSKCICSDDPFVLHAEEETSIEFKPYSSINSEDIFFQRATCMREHYPFVVLIALKITEEVSDTCMVAMASAIHVPDRNLSLYPQLIAQYTKVLSGHVGQVKKVFLSSPATSDDGTNECDLCLICYSKPVSIVLLPCRHACLCSTCFELCDTCPVCRASAPSCFELPVTHANDHSY